MTILFPAMCIHINASYFPLLMDGSLDILLAINQVFINKSFVCLIFMSDMIEGFRMSLPKTRNIYVGNLKQGNGAQGNICCLRAKYVLFNSFIYCASLYDT